MNVLQGKGIGKGVLQKNGITWDSRYIWLIFCGAVLIKLVIAGLFSSDYQDKMFEPFVNVFIGGEENPYHYYYDHNLVRSFPYPPVMLYIVSAGGILRDCLSFGSEFFANILFKLPLLVFDIIGYGLLLKLCKNNHKYVMVLYFLSPVIIYSTYAHGQLDIIPTTVFLAAVYVLVKSGRGKRALYISAFIFCLAVMSKTHILAAAPIQFFYIKDKYGYKDAILYTITWVVASVAMILPYMSEGFLDYVLLNKESSYMMDVYIDYGTTKLVLPMLVVFIVYIRTYQIRYINKNLLMNLMGILFSVFLVFVPPMPAWFVWIIPFVVIYYVENDANKYKMLWLYAVFNAVYMIYFVFFHHTGYVDLYWMGRSLDFLKIPSGTGRAVSFTLMVCMLAYIIVDMYRMGIASNSFYRRAGKYFTIGIAGDSGVGKTELLHKFSNLLGTENILQIEGDGDHRWERDDENWSDYTPLNPKANYLYRQARDIRIIREGGAVSRVEYMHETGKFSAYKKKKGRPYIVLSGLHALYLPQMRDVLDLKIYIDTEKKLQTLWKIKRDVGERGYNTDEVLGQINRRLDDVGQYIYPQRKYANLIIEYFDETITDELDLNHEVSLSLRMHIDMDWDVENLLDEFRMAGIFPKHEICDDMVHQEILFLGSDVRDKDINLTEIAEATIRQYDDLFIYEPIWEDGVEGILQVFLLAMIAEKMKVVD